VKLMLRSRLEDSPFRFRDAKHAMSFEGPLQHRPIARLENVQRKQRMREKRRFRKHHHGRVCGKIEGAMTNAFHSNAQRRLEMVARQLPPRRSFAA
jgi:hypothetical protein